MTEERSTFWDRLSLRWKGAFIVGAPIMALLLSALTGFWFDRQNDRTEALARQARGHYTSIDHVVTEIHAAVMALQRYTVTEDPDVLPSIDSTLLQHVAALGEMRDPSTGEPYPGARATSASIKELLLSAAVLARDMTGAGEPSEREEDALDHLGERIVAKNERLEIPSARADRVATQFERELAAIEDREEKAEAVTILIGLTGGLLAAAFFARNFTTRISELGAAAEHLAAGDFGRPFPRGSDEIGDLAERVHDAFSALRESEERSRLILETSADGYTAMDEQWTVTAWNRSAEEITGWTKEEALGRNLMGLTLPRERHAAMRADYERYLASGASAILNNRVETTALRKDGSIVPIDLSVVPVRSGERLTFHAFIRDLTERKRAEEDTARRALRMAEIIQTMSQMAAADLDVKRLHELLLERARSLAGADGVALQLEHDGVLNVVAGIGPVAAHVGRKLDIATSMTGSALRTGKAFVTGDVLEEEGVDLALSRDIGTRAAIAVPLSDASKVVGVLAVHSSRVNAFGDAEVTDLEILGGFFGAIISKIQASVAREVVVHERTEALEELRAVHDELARKNEALVAATAEANAANQAKSEFLSRMSHELRTPLNAILGFAQLLQNDPLEEDQADSVCHIENAGRHLLALINEVLEISRIESGKTSVSLEPVDLVTIVRQSIDLVRPLAADRHVTVSLAGAASGEVTADPQRVKQIMLNLLSNAVKYNRDGGSVEVSIEEGDGDLCVAVIDTGHGIPTDKLRSLFTPFERLGAEGSSVEGTGLGLAVSKQLAEAMGGEVSLVSTHGSGSTFTLHLQRSEPGPPQPPHGAPPAERGAPARDHRHVVVHVEDNPSNARLVDRALRLRPNVDLHVATTAAAGIELAAALRPALVLLDMNLPDATGMEVLRELGQRADTAPLPVVVVSADATGDKVEAALAAGAAGYLTKPLDLAELVATVDRFTAAHVKVEA